MANSVMEAPPAKGGKDVLKFSEGPVIFQLIQQVAPRIKGEPPYPAKYELTSRQLSYDPETGENRMLRFLEGVRQIWQDEQKDIKDEAAKNLEWLPLFVKGTLLLRWPEDKAKINYMVNRDDYDGKERRLSQKPPLFTLVNKEAEYESKLSFIEARHKAEDVALKANYDDLLQHAIWLNINLLDGLRPKSEVEIREEYVNKASGDPTLFLKTYDSPVMKVSSLIKQALNKGLIDMAHVQGEARWMEGKALITTLNPKEETLKQLTEFALSKQGDSFRTKVTNSLKK